MEQIQMVQVDHLHPHEKNPRIEAGKQIDDLMDSIRENGIRVPLVLAPREDGTTYTVIAGHRRLAAAHGLGLTEVPAQVDGALADPREQMKFMLLENVQRSDLSPMEESRAVQGLLDLGVTQAQLAKQSGLGKDWVAGRANLSKVAQETGEKIHEGQISITEALLIAEYADDRDIVEELEHTAGSVMFDQAAARAKARREGRKRVDAAKKKAKKDGLRITHAEDHDFVPLLELSSEGMWSTPELNKLALTDPEDDEWERALIDAHADCPGHCIQIIEWGYFTGESSYGCDQVDAQHETAFAGELPDDEAAAPEPEPDPLDDFTPEDLQTMRFDRESKIATALTTTDLTDWALDDLTNRALKGLDDLSRHYDSDEYRNILLGFLGLAPDATTTKITKTIRSLSWPSRYVFAHYARVAVFQHGPMSTSTRAWPWRSTQHNNLDELLRIVGAEPSDLEKKLRTLHNNPWDKPDTDSTDDGAALADGGDRA